MLVLGFVSTDLLPSCVHCPPGDYEAQLGSQRLEAVPHIFHIASERRPIWQLSRAWISPFIRERAD